MTKNILCYGDSNTWGYVPISDRNATVISRFTRDKRWPGRLQNLLGDTAHIIEEGLNGRTTNVNHVSPPDRNGKTYLPSCLYSHAPIDLVILALGGNDFKTYFNRSAADIKAGLAELIDIIQSSPYGPDMQSAPDILIVTPGQPLPITEHHIDEDGVQFMKGCSQKAKELVAHYDALANEKNCHFLDISPYCGPSEIDGVHLDETGHAKMADIMHKVVIGILKSYDTSSSEASSSS